ncbi:MAG: hypothetical protein ACO398_06595 [Kiritimatiellia bacterium]
MKSDFTRNSLRESLARYNVTQQEARHREGYERHPVASNEFAIWENEQTWIADNQAAAGKTRRDEPGHTFCP